MQKKSETGRSMVELLGVLAIMGVLSLVLLQGYKYAIRRNRIGQTLNQISTAVAGARTVDLQRIAEAELISDAAGNVFIPVKYVISDVQFKSNDPYSFTTPLNADISVYRDSRGVWRVRTDYTENMTTGDCEALITSNVAENGIGINGRIYSHEYLLEHPEKTREICEELTKTIEVPAR